MMGNNNMDYTELLKEVGEDNFNAWYKELLASIDKFLSEAEYPDSVICNERILYHVLLDYYSDISRLKLFHEIKHTKTDKVIAYTIYWILRRKPIQLAKFSDSEHDIFVNERYACNLLLAECLLGENVNITNSKVLDDLDKYIDLLLYYFKYRELNPQVIELMIESFKMGNGIKD
ncbi:MAG: hypothetical protein NC347_02100 [Clostridium sp.]|nr:hypothetical protein [Clostridium sp.]